MSSFRDQITAVIDRRSVAPQSDRRVTAAKVVFDAGMRAAEERFERERSLIRASFVAEISGGGAPVEMDNSFWPPPPHSNKPTRFDWHGFLFAALLAVAIGMLLRWLYTIVRLMQIF